MMQELVSTLDPLAVALDGTTLIEASAGTGKTHTITTLYLRLVIERGLLPAQILVVTYTNAATAELRSRVRRRLGEAAAALRAGGCKDDPILDALVRRRAALGTALADQQRVLDALHAFDEAAIFTIHGFCQRILHENAFESGVDFDAELIADVSPLVADVVRDFWVARLIDASRLELEYLAQRKTSLASVEQLVFRTLSYPRLIVRPQAPGDAGELPTGLGRWQSAFEVAARLWAARRDEIVDLLCRSALNRRSYPIEGIRGPWALGLDQAFAAAQPLICWRFEKLAKLTAKAVAAGALKNAAPLRHDFFEACSRLCAAEEEIELGLRAWRLRFLHDALSYTATQLHARKREQHAQSFDDLLQQLESALAGAAGEQLAEVIRGRYPVVLIDEFQDTDPVQYAIFRQVYLAHGTLFLIGDPKQAIYAFRGADVFTYVRAKRDAGGVPRTLETNRRSDPSLLRAINTLFERARAQFVYAEIPYRTMQPHASEDRLAPAELGAFEILMAAEGELDTGVGAGIDGRRIAIAEAVAAEIVRFLGAAASIEGRPVEPADIAVLCRTNDETRRMQQALRALGVHSVLQTQESVFESSDARDLERVLRAIADPADNRALRAALITPLFGVDGHGLQALEQDERQWDQWVNRFQRWQRLFLERGFMAALRALLEEVEVPARLLRRPDGERRLTNILHLLELLHQAASGEHLGAQALAQWLAVMRSDEVARAALAGEAVQIRLESDAAAVKLVTIHKSKGLEYPIVYYPFLWDGPLVHRGDAQYARFHDPANEDQLTLCLDSKSEAVDQALVRREALAENLRLLYVALTRARHRCSLVWGSFKNLHDSALAYLLHQSSASAALGQEEIVERTWSRIRELEEHDVAADLEALRAAAPEVIRIRKLSLEGGSPYDRGATSPPSLAARGPAPTVRLAQRTASFSALIAAAPTINEAEQEGVDHDAAVDATEKAAAPAPVALPVTLHDFPAGPRSGDLLHEIYEHLDFQAASEEVLTAVVADRIRRYGFEGRWIEPVARSVREVLGTALSAPPVELRLAEVGPSQRRNEMEFIFSVAEAGARGFDRQKLAAAFARSASPVVEASYVERLQRLRFSELRGFLKGYMDMVFEHRGRWYIVDYKSNRLGTQATDYVLERLQRAMGEHHYYLQYHLYAVALHRHLRLRQPDYDYERHFGGALYLFLRGMAPHHPRGSGIFYDRPSRAMIEELDAMLA